jgi:hypothetical protein
MVLNAQEQAELERLTAKADEPAPVVREVTITLAADYLKVIRDLAHVHWSQLPADAYEAFKGAVDAALAEPEPEPEPAEAAEPVPAEAAEPEPAEAAEPVPEPVFGTESEPESHEV